MSGTLSRSGTAGGGESPALELRGVRKVFGSFAALDGVDLTM